MNKRDNFLRMMERGDPFRLPYDLRPTPPVAEMIREKTGLPVEEALDVDFAAIEVCYPDDDPARWRAAYNEMDCFLSLPDNAEVAGMGVARQSNQRPGGDTLNLHLSELLHPLAEVDSVADVQRLPWPDLERPLDIEPLARRVGEIHAGGRVAVGALECTVFEVSWYLRGMEGIFVDLHEGGPVTEWLFDYFTRRSEVSARAMVTAGVDLIRLGDDVGTQRGLLMSIETWRLHLKPRLRRVVDAIREASMGRKIYVQYHSDGAVSELIDDLIEVGIDILNPVQPECMDLEAVSQKYRDRIAFSGMIGTQTTLPFGTTDDVRQAVERCKTLHRNGARIIVAPTHVVEPDVPWENIVAFINAVKRFTRNTD